MAKSHKKCTVYLREVKEKRILGAAQKHEMTIALFKPHHSAVKGTEPLPRFQGQSVNVSLKCQKWGSPSITAQHYCLSRQSHQKTFTWTTQKLKNTQKNKLATFLYFISGIVPHLFLWSYLELLFAITFHSRPIASFLFYQLCIFKFFLYSAINFPQ